MVVMASFITTCINVGVLISLGALFVPISEKYGTNRPTTALVQSLALGASAFAVIAGALIEKYGLWKMALVGTILTSVGFGGGFFATTIAHLYIFISAIAGTGIAIMYMCSSVAVGMVTEGRLKSTALAINSSCIALGGCVYTQLLNFLITLYGLNGTYLIIAGMCCNNMGLVLLVSNVRIPNSTVAIAMNNLDNFDSNVTMGVSCIQKATFLIQSFIGRIKVKLLKIFTVPYALILIATVITMSSLDGYIVIYVDIFTWKAYSEQQGLTSMVPFQISCIFAALLVGMLKQFKAVDSFAVSIVFSLIGCVGYVLIYASSNLWMAYVGSVLLGATDGGTFASVCLIVAGLVPEDYFGTAYGLIITVFTSISTTAGPFFGSLRDVTESYTSVFLTMVIIQIITAVLFLAAMIAHRRSKSTKSAQDPITGFDNPSFTLDGNDDG